jgi:hypothetical protein
MSLSALSKSDPGLLSFLCNDLAWSDPGVQNQEISNIYVDQFDMIIVR